MHTVKQIAQKDLQGEAESLCTVLPSELTLRRRNLDSYISKFSHLLSSIFMGINAKLASFLLASSVMFLHIFQWIIWLKLATISPNSCISHHTHSKRIYNFARLSVARGFPGLPAALTDFPGGSHSLCSRNPSAHVPSSATSLLRSSVQASSPRNGPCFSLPIFPFCCLLHCGILYWPLVTGT